MQTLIFSFQYASNLVINSVNHFSLQTLIGPFEDLSNGPFAISNENILIDQSVKRLLPRRFNFYCLLWTLLEAEVNQIFQIKMIIVLKFIHLKIFWTRKSSSFIIVTSCQGPRQGCVVPIINTIFFKDVNRHPNDYAPLGEFDVVSRSSWKIRSSLTPPHIFLPSIAPMSLTPPRGINEQQKEHRFCINSIFEIGTSQ